MKTHTFIIKTTERWLSVYNNFLISFGLDIKKTLKGLKSLPLYFKNLRVLKKQAEESKMKFKLSTPFLCLDDINNESGNTKGHYFYQDWLVANRIFINTPKKHVDVGSRIDGFVSHVATFRQIQVLDIRPLTTKISNLEFIQADLMSPLEKKLIGYCDSLSCLHTLEHFGLGRYGDSINYDGYLVGLKNLTKLLKKNGKFYLSVPIGPQRIEFNAHRVFSIRYLLELFKGEFLIEHFSFIDDEGNLYQNVELDDQQILNNFGCQYGCGIFEMIKW